MSFDFNTLLVMTSCVVIMILVFGFINGFTAPNNIRTFLLFDFTSFDSIDTAKNIDSEPTVNMIILKISQHIFSGQYDDELKSAKRGFSVMNFVEDVIRIYELAMLVDGRDDAVSLLNKNQLEIKSVLMRALNSSPSFR